MPAVSQRGESAAAAEAGLAFLLEAAVKPPTLLQFNALTPNARRPRRYLRPHKSFFVPGCRCCYCSQPFEAFISTQYTLLLSDPRRRL